MDGACCNEAKIPDSPPDRARPKASGAQPRRTVIQIVGANPFSAEQSLVVSFAALDVSVTHRPPLLGLKAQHMGNLVNAVRPLQSGFWQPGEPYNGKRSNVVMLMSNAAQIPSWALQREWIDTKKQPDVARYSFGHACSSTRAVRLTPMACGVDVLALGSVRRRRLIAIEFFGERIWIVETFGPNMLRKRL